eukprot:m.9819 g.9819  ORF g.9819 m.9819 type:complete len:494 (+) comp21674_c0_seq1:136-1617(+)
MTTSILKSLCSHRIKGIQWRGILIAVVAFYANFLLLGKLYSVSLLVNELLKPPCGNFSHLNSTLTNFTLVDVGNTSNANENTTLECGGFGQGRGPTAWTGSTILSMYFLASAISGPLSDVFSLRKTAFIGAVITSISTLISSFAPNLPLFIVFFSVGGGFGTSLVIVASIYVILVHHPKRFAFMMGLTVAGSGLGIVTFGLTYPLLLNSVGWRWTVRLFSSLVFILAILILFYSNSGSEDPKGEVGGDDCISYVLAIRTGTSLEGNNSSGKPDECYVMSNEESPQSHRRSIEWKLLWNPYVLAIGLGRSLGYFGYSISLVHMVSFSEDIGVSNSQFTVISYGLGEFIGRIGVGLLGTWAKSQVHYIQQLAIFFTGFSTVLVPTITSLAPLIAHTFAIGVLTGSCVASDPVVLRDLLGKEKVAQALGFIWSFRAPFTLIAPPIAGWIFDAVGDYQASFYLGGAVAIFGSVIYFIIPLKQRRNRSLMPVDSSAAA